MSAEDRKFDAEAAAAQALARRHASEAAKAEAEAEVALQEARNKRAQADVAEIMRDREARKEQAELASNVRHFVYNFDGVVDRASAKKCIDQLTEWDRTHQDAEIEIIFHSPGGSVIDGLALFDVIQALKERHEITTTTIGMAASMAGVLLQAGQKRIMGKNSVILIHEVSAGASGKVSDIDDEVAFMKMLQKRLLNILAERSTMSPTQIATKWRKTDWWLDSETALKLGFVDAIR